MDVLFSISMQLSMPNGLQLCTDKGPADTPCAQACDSPPPASASNRPPSANPLTTTSIIQSTTVPNPPSTRSAHSHSRTTSESESHSSSVSEIVQADAASTAQTVELVSAESTPVFESAEAVWTDALPMWQRARIHSLVVTREDASRQFAVVLTFFERVAQSSMRERMSLLQTEYDHSCGLAQDNSCASFDLSH